MCYRPIQVRSKQGTKETVPCGKCPQCAYTKTAGWTFRLLQEERVSKSAHFITLTYNNDHIVSTPNGFASVTRYDLQCFFKRLRKRQALCMDRVGGCAPIKYYAVGEYGSQTKRPHYHAIIFNAFDELIDQAWSLDGQKIGDVFFGDVCAASIGYTLKYLNKKSTIGRFGIDDRHPQFTQSSNGLGISYLTAATIHFHLADLHNRSYLTLPGGLKASMPRYYYEKIYDGYNRDLLKMSGSLIRQDDFYKNFMSVPVEQRLRDTVLYEKRVQAAFDKADYLNSKTLTI